MRCRLKSPSLLPSQIQPPTETRAQVGDRKDAAPESTVGWGQTSELATWLERGAVPAVHRKQLVLVPGNESGARSGALRSTDVPGKIYSWCGPAEGSPDAHGGRGGRPPSCVDMHQQ